MPAWTPAQPQDPVASTALLSLDFAVVHEEWEVQTVQGVEHDLFLALVSLEGN